jgi:hypothetical protein
MYMSHAHRKLERLIVPIVFNEFYKRRAMHSHMILHVEDKLKIDVAQVELVKYAQTSLSYGSEGS